MTMSQENSLRTNFLFNGTLKDKNVVAVKAYKDLSQELELIFLQEAKTLQTT